MSNMNKELIIKYAFKLFIIGILIGAYVAFNQKS